MNTIVTDAGFAPDDWTFGFYTPNSLPDILPPAVAVTLDSAAPIDPVINLLAAIDLIRVTFPTFADGRGFSLAAQLRLAGFHGRLRAFGPVLADQYAMARRAGFDEVEIPPELARRQPQADWQARINWRAHDYQSRLRQFEGL